METSYLFSFGFFFGFSLAGSSAATTVPEPVLWRDAPVPSLAPSGGRLVSNSGRCGGMRADDAGAFGLGVLPARRSSTACRSLSCSRS